MKYLGRLFFFSMMTFGFGGALVAQPAPAPAPTPVAPTPTHEILVVIGAAGEPTFVPGFEAAATAWKDACKRAGADCTVIDGAASQEETKPTGATEALDDRARIERWFAGRAPKSELPLWFVYIGHGTFDGRLARLNLRGPDVSTADLSAWLKPLNQRPIIIVHGGSASGPFIPALSGPNRIVIAATRSGEEVNYARFGERFAEAVASPEADIDQDGQTSLLEAFLTAAQRVQSRYTELGRMATEHALIDDNGDKLGTPAEWFKGTRLIKRPDNGATADGVRAGEIALVATAEERALTTEQRTLRDGYEKELAALRAQKEKLPEPEYWRRVEVILRKLAVIYSKPAT